MVDRLIQHFFVEGCETSGRRTATGREAWALQQLVAAGPDGCTPISTPGPRWSAYVHALRHEHGLVIETAHERHEGQFPGSHARYILRSDVRLLESQEAA